MSDVALEYSEYWPESNYDPVTRHAWQFHDAASYGGVTYGKSAMVLGTLEGLIGTEAMDEAMRTYFMRFRFQHPTTEDFLKTVEEVAIRRGRATGVPAVQSGGTSLDQYHVVIQAGQGALAGLLAGLPQTPVPGVFVGSSLRPFFNQAVYGTAVLDYAVEQVRSGPAAWWKPEEGQTQFRSEVTLQRIGDFRMPVTVEVVFADGTRVRERWDGAATDNDRWKRFVYVRGARVASAELDPEHLLLLDHDRFNNSFRVKADGVPARKMTNLYASGMQLLSEMVGYLI